MQPISSPFTYGNLKPAKPAKQFSQQVADSLQRADDCALRDDPHYAEFVSRSVDDASRLLDPKSVEGSFVSMAKRVGSSLSAHPNALNAFWHTAAHVAGAGISGTAAVALAQVSKAVAQFNPDAAETLNKQTVSTIHFAEERSPSSPSTSEKTRAYFDTLNHAPDMSAEARKQLAAETVISLAQQLEYNIL